MTYSGISAVTLHGFVPGVDLNVVGLVDRGRSDDKAFADVVEEWFGVMQPTQVVSLQITVEGRKASAGVDVSRTPIDVSFESLRPDGSVARSAESSPMEIGRVADGVAEGLVGIWPVDQDVRTIRVGVMRPGDSSPTVTLAFAASDLSS